MFRTSIIIALFAVACTANAQPPHPHLAQAWVAQSTGDGLPNMIGQESYLYEGCEKPSDTCMNGHVWNYGAKTCIKYEVDRGFDSAYSGTYYVSCDAVDCCTSAERVPADIKKWDLGQGGRILDDKITYLGKKDTTELNNKPVKGADAWFENFNLPFTHGIKVNYTYFITGAGEDVITHRIDFAAPGQGGTGSILYGDFQIQKNLTEFRKVFEAPAACLKPNVMTCPSEKVKEWNRKYFKHAALLQDL